MLVIIGLIVGGVLVGQTLIGSAQLRRQMTDSTAFCAFAVAEKTGGL